MPLRSRKTRSSSGKTDEETSPSSNGGRTHPKEMYAPDRATRSRMSTEDLVILDLPKSSRSFKKTESKGSKAYKDDPKKGDKSGDRLNSSSNSKQVNNVNNSGGTSSHFNEGTPSNRTRRRSGRQSGDSAERETPKKTSPHTAREQPSARSERRRRRSGPDELDNSVADNKNAKSDRGRHSGRRRSSTDEKSPVGKSDVVKETKKGSVTNKKPDPDPPDNGNFKVPSIANKSKSSDPLDNTLLESPRPSRRHGGKSAAIDTVLSVDVDVDVTSNDSLSSRTSPRRPKASPRSDKKASKDGEKASTAVNNAAPLSPRTRSIAAKNESDNQDVKSSTSDSSRKRRPSGDVDDTHSNRKRKRTGSVCRDLTSQFDDGKSENGESSKTANAENLEEDDSVGDKSENLEKDDSGNLLSDLDSLKDDNSVSQSAKPDRKGTSTPTNSPRKFRSKSPGRSPASRRGLRSAGPRSEGQIEAIPSELSEDAKEEDSSVPKESPAESVDISGVEDATTSQERTEDTNENRKEDTTIEDIRTDDYEEELVQLEDIKPDLGEFEEFHGEDWYEDSEDTELFFFESDHVALKGNRDYRMMLRTLSTLEAQRKQAVQDLDVLIDKKKEALHNPVSFARKLQQRDDMELPHPQRVVVLPDIEWEKYLGAAEAIEMAGFKHQTRGAKSSGSKHSASALAGPSQPSLLSAVTQLSQKSSASQLQIHQSPMPSTSSTPDAFVMETAPRKEPCVVRGRASVDPNKPASFNQLWTVDEQRKLEELLVKFPMEEVEARRWEKVARALGNRTSQQVASRVQKYFIKLTKAGLPVPGRIPNMTYYTNRKRNEKRMHPFTKTLYQSSTFLQSVTPPVYMAEDENVGWSGYMGDDDDDDLVSDDEAVPVELRATEEYHELLRLKKMKKDKLKAQSLMSHQGYKCDGCSMEPIVGIRWHCIDCPADVSTDLCQACVDCDFSSTEHSSSHQMEPIQYNYGGGPSFVDTDYTRFTPITGDYNYLDPNYNPSALPT